MDNEKKLVEELLKSDGIDPAVISDTERAAFREMLDSEQQRIRRISWCITGMMWIFAAAMICLCFSERVLEALHIPFAAAGIIAAAAICIVMIPLVFRFYKRLMSSKKKAIHLEKVIYGRREYKGLVMVGVKDGKRFIHWPNIFLIIIAIWLLMSIGGAGVYYLLCSRWIFIESPVLYTFFCTFASLIVVIHGVRQGLKAPLEELADVKPEQYVRSRRISKFIFAAMIIFFGPTIWYIFFNTIESIAWADVVEKVKSVSFLNATFYIRDKTSSETVQVDFWLGSEGRERIKTREQVIFAKNGRIILGFNYVKQEKIDKEQIDRQAQIVIDMLEDSESFSLDTVVQKMSNGVLKEITPLINQEAVISEDVIVFDLTSEQNNQWLRIWALRESKLPIRILAWNPDNGQYADVIFNYSQKQSAAFFDPDEYQKFLRNSDNILGDSETNLAYALYKEPVGKNYVPADVYKKYRNTEDLRTLKEHLSDVELVEYYKAHPLEEGQMDFRKGQKTGGLTISSIQGLENYKIFRIGTTVDFFARGYHVPSYGRMRFEGDFNDVFLQYDIVGRGEISYQKYIEAVLSRVGLEIIESEDLCTVWIAEYNGQELKPARTIKIPLPNAPARTPGSLAGYPMSSDVKFLLRCLARDQDVVVEDNTGIDKDKQLSDVLPNFKTEKGAELAEKWYLENFGITFKKEQRRMPVWIIRKKQ